MVNCSLSASNPTSVVVKTVRYSSILLLSFGTLGILMTIGTFCINAIRRSKITTYLLTLLFVDLIAIWMNFPRCVWITYYWDSPDTDVTFLNSKTFRCLTLIVTIYSSWIIVAISAERLLAVCCPFSRHFSTKEYIPKLVLFILLLCLSIIFVSAVYIIQNVVYMYLFSITLFSFIPAMFLIISSIILIYTLHKRPHLGQQREKNITTVNMNIIYIVIAINLVFLLTKFPLTTYALVTLLRYCTITGTFVLLDVFSMVNNCMNFILYFISSQIFRENFMSVCLRKEKPKRHDMFNSEQKI